VLCCTVLQIRAEGRRGKVPLEKGFSQVAWVKLTKSGADLTGGRNRARVCCDDWAGGWL
jgi:hypothetical protein